ncbi:4-vinyl reductase [Acuticoccus sp. MNP-M23]|uniref:4-vinyl reductase n=1 Tax=Acuticoccus sp. MNP-M23 TaxID=3072793 RepID=UPI002814F31E|nr:4-vinyl reductase [Acuticoccus sp. MNP-M23]WMS41460.1 4-vinyl reductase [Acuticoccus sp. MNP-M23]
MRFHERLRHDEPNGAHYDGDIRYMMIRPDALMGIFARLDPAARQAAMEAFRDSIIERGGQSAATYVSADGIDRLLGVIEATAADLGWGRWHFERIGDGYGLTVRNSPFGAAAPFEGPACHAIVGMATIVGTMVLGAPATATETACVASGAAECRFVVEPEQA